MQCNGQTVAWHNEFHSTTVESFLHAEEDWGISEEPLLNVDWLFVQSISYCCIAPRSEPSKGRKLAR